MGEVLVFVLDFVCRKPTRLWHGLMDTVHLRCNCWWLVSNAYS